MRKTKLVWLSIAATAALTACSGGSNSNSNTGTSPPPPQTTPDSGCSGFCANASSFLTEDDVSKVIAQAVNEALAQYRWHGSNMTNVVAPDLTTLVSDIWKTMDIVEALREKKPGVVRRTKLTGLVSVRAGIMAKRFRQLGNMKYSRDIVKMARAHTGWPLWLAGQFLVQLRELLVYKIARRPRHRQNIFS